jgi:hypothetical protein
MAVALAVRLVESAKVDVCPFFRERHRRPTALKGVFHLALHLPDAVWGVE